MTENVFFERFVCPAVTARAAETSWPEEQTVSQTVNHPGGSFLHARVNLHERVAARECRLTA